MGQSSGRFTQLSAQPSEWLRSLIVGQIRMVVGQLTVKATGQGSRLDRSDAHDTHTVAVSGGGDLSGPGRTALMPMTPTPQRLDAHRHVDLRFEQHLAVLQRLEPGNVRQAFRQQIGGFGQ